MWLGTIRRLGLYFGPLMLGSAAARALCAASCPDVAGAMFAGGERAPVNGLMLAVAHWKQQRGELEFDVSMSLTEVRNMNVSDALGVGLMWQ